MTLTTSALTPGLQSRQLSTAIARGTMAPFPVSFDLCLVATLSAALFACDDDSQPRYETSCERNCARVGKCTGEVDEAACSQQCKDDLAQVGPQLRGDYLAEVDECVASLSCSELALASVLQTCPSQAQALLAPSRTAQDLCDSVVSSFDECLGIKVSAAGCLEESKIFSDAALRKARRCEEKPCDDRPECLRGALGSDVTPQGRRSLLAP